MSHLHAVPRDEAPEEFRHLYDESIAKIGEPTGFIQAAANAPELLDWYFNSYYARVFYGGRIDVRTKELLRLKLSKLQGCST